MKKKVIVATDLDGTLLNSNHKLSDKDQRTLLGLKEEGHLRVVATGRILYSAMQVLAEDFPIDYLVFSSGGGILDWHTKKLIHSNSMEQDDLIRSLDLLESMGLNFMVHGPVPENHFCLCKSGENFDLKDHNHRVENYRAFHTPWSERENFLSEWGAQASVIVSSVPTQVGAEIYGRLKDKLPELHVVRATSPLDSNYNWIEILPTGVSKASGCQWLKEYLGATNRKTIAVGNDYNDIDMLEWADTSYVVSNTPEELKSRYHVVVSNDESGFSEAIKIAIND